MMKGMIIIQELLSAVFTRANITLALSIFGAVGTLVTFISSYLTKRKNLKISITSAIYRNDLRWLLCAITFENRSRLPIAITSIFITANDKTIKPKPYPCCVNSYAHRIGNDVIDRKFEYNLKLPADIQQLSALSGHVLFELSPTEIENLSTPLTLAIHSTRGRVQKIELSPNLIKQI